MYRHNLKFFLTIFLTAAVIIFAGTYICAAADYQNPETGYCVRIEDDAGLLLDEEEAALLDNMIKVTGFGNAAFKSIDVNNTTTESYIIAYYREVFGTESGVVFLIDTYNRNIWIYSDGAVYNTITTAYADTITDNVYKYATRADYFKCANEAFSQINSLLAGRKIRQPMKYISNALFAMILALLANYIFVNRLAKIKTPDGDDIIRRIERKIDCTKPEVVFTGKTKIYSPRSSDSDGGSSGSSGSSSSGGGGGHSF